MQVAENDPAALYLGKMEKAGSRAKKLVDQILAFSRQSTPQRAPVAVSGIIDEVVDLIESTTAPSLHVRKRIEIEDAAIEADSTQIHQILMNLCTNAVHAMGEAGGILTVGVRSGGAKHGGAAATGNGSTQKPLMLFVEDTGEGKSPEDFAQLS
jgi:signal transduction histidine kinase